MVLACGACGAAPAPETVAAPESATETSQPETSVAQASPTAATERATTTDADADVQAARTAAPSTTLPAPAAPGEAGAPIENLAPWALGLPDDGRIRILAPDAGALLVIDAERFVAVHGDGTTPTLVRDNPVGHGVISADSTLPAAAIAAGAFLVRGAEDLVAAVDLATLEVRWTARLGATVAGSHEAHLSSGDAFLVIARDDLIALDPASGAVLWRASFPRARFFSRGQSWRAAGGLFVALDGGLVAREARTGAERWRVDGFDSRSDRLFDPVGDRLPILQREELAIVSLTDGRELARIRLPAIPPNGRTVLLAGDALYVALPPAGDGPGAHLEVRRYDLARTGTARWRSATFATDGSGFHPSIAVDDDAVLVCTTSRFVRALDLDSGRERWSASTASCSAPRLWRPREGAPNVVFTSDWSREGLARAAIARPSRRIAISGVVRCDGRPASGAWVWIDGERARADASGRYRASVRASDTVEIFVEQYEISELGFCSSERRTVPVAGARLAADFALGPGGGDGI